MTGKNILIAIDGTWMTSRRQGNVYKLYSAAEESDKQVKFYFEGLGTRWYSKHLGGIFGLGIKRQILSAYSAIVDTFSPGDQIYLFGFSRGAYAVRALSGLLYFSGVLKREHRNKVKAAWKYYRSRRNYKQFDPKLYSDPCVIAMLGCFDTVASIGIPFTKRYSRGWFPHLYPMPNVQTVRHALAADERRRFFRALLFEERPEGFNE